MGIRPTFCQYLKVVPFEVVTSCRDVDFDSRCMTGTCDPYKMFGFSVMQSSLSFSNPAVCVLFLIKLRWPRRKNFYDSVV